MNDDHLVAGCFSCDQARRGATLPIRERIYDDGLWRVAHAFNNALPGWLVLLPLRHVTSIAELTADEAARLGPLIHQVSQALHAITGCQKPMCSSLPKRKASRMCISTSCRACPAGNANNGERACFRF